MKHEQFGVFRVTKEQTVDGVPELNEFLLSNISPKSISVSRQDEGGAIIVIGYTDEHSEEEYHIRALAVTLDENTDDLELEDIIELEAERTNGVICQDVHLNGSELEVIFLTTK